MYGRSERFAYWKSIEDWWRCKPCKDTHGKIYLIEREFGDWLRKWLKKWRREHGYFGGLMHVRCRCWIYQMRTVAVGSATRKKEDGADWWLKYRGRLPPYYLTKEEAKSEGWVPRLWNLGDMLPGKMVYGLYENRNGHLPAAPGRIWYEADINYVTGKRGKQRILFSSDGLLFVTYNHYEEFKEIV